MNIFDKYLSFISAWCARKYISPHNIGWGGGIKLSTCLLMSVSSPKFVLRLTSKLFSTRSFLEYLSACKCVHLGFKVLVTVKGSKVNSKWSLNEWRGTHALVSRWVGGRVNTFLVVSPKIPGNLILKLLSLVFGKHVMVLNLTLLSILYILAITLYFFIFCLIICIVPLYVTLCQNKSI